MMPRVSIIMPAYNAARFIRRAVESILAQTHKEIELVVIDDGSTDATAEIVRSYEDQRIVYLWQPNAGQGPARNAGIRRCRGELIAFLDADDYYFPTKVNRQVEFLQGNPEYKVVYCNAVHFYEGRPDVLYRGKLKGRSGNVLSELLQTSYINPNTVMIAREVLDAVGPINETRYYPEEWELWLKIALAGFAFGYIDEDLVVVEIRRRSNTTMEIQPILKQNAVKMFETVVPPVIEVDGMRLNTAPALRAMKWKLAIAHLATGSRGAFIRTVADLVSPRPAGYALGALLALVPSTLVRWLWQMRQFRRWDVALPVDAARAAHSAPRGAA